MTERSTSSLLMELVKRVRLPSLANTFWILRICLLLFTFFVISNWADIVTTISGIFGGQVTQAVEVVEDGVDEITERQTVLEAKVDAISNHKDDIIQEIRNERQNAAHEITSAPTSTEIAPSEGLKITPSSTLSDDDNVIEEIDESLYIQERKRSTIRPSGE